MKKDKNKPQSNILYQQTNNIVILLWILTLTYIECRTESKYEKVSQLIESMIEANGSEGYLFLMSEFDCEVCTNSIKNWEPQICLVQKNNAVWASGFYYVESKNKKELPDDVHSTCISWQTSTDGNLFGAVVRILETKAGPYVIKIVNNKIVYIRAVNGNTFE